MSAIEDRLRELLLLGLAGEASAYHTFLKELSAHLRAFLRGRLSRLPDEVEDLLQETLLAIHNQRRTYDAGQPLTAWVHAIARYKLVDLLRRRAGRDALNDPLDDELAVFAHSDSEAADARRDLGKLLERLPDGQRLPIVHMKLEGLSVVEVAKLPSSAIMSAKAPVMFPLPAARALFVFPGISAELIELADKASLYTSVIVSPAPAPALAPASANVTLTSCGAVASQLPVAP